MSSFDSEEDLAITQAWYSETRPSTIDNTTRDSMWLKIFNKFVHDYGNPRGRTAQEIEQRHDIILNAVVEFLKIKYRINQSTRNRLSPEQLVSIYTILS